MKSTEELLKQAEADVDALVTLRELTNLSKMLKDIDECTSEIKDTRAINVYIEAARRSFRHIKFNFEVKASKEVSHEVRQHIEEVIETL